ncbi:MAG TPA: ATP-binding protein [Nocardioidaceae bacterium]|nr:ATP-binding protein [Nocardioidaceae bacterium]
MTDGEHRGRLRLYLGAAPGVGKTYAMLGEGHRRAARGTDVIAALVETHGRPLVEEQLEGLAQVPPRTIDGFDGFDEVDVEAVLARRPDVVLVDDLAHTNAPGSPRPKRWQDVAALLDAGIDVISTVNIEQLESLADVVESITGMPQRDAVPDHVVREAEQIELVDMTPEALRRRMAHGNIYPAEQVDAALSHYFRVGNLAALRELALLWLADRVDEGLERYRHDHDIESTWAARERVVVALTGGPESDLLLRRGARIASRGAGGELHAVYVAARHRTAAPGPDELARLRVLTEELGGTHHTVISDDPAEGVLDLARSLNATQIVLGVSRRPRWRSLFGAGVSERVIAGSDDIDVLVVTHPFARRGVVVPGRGGLLGTRRLLLGWILAVLGPALLSTALVPTRDLPTLALEAMSYLALTVTCALVGGLWPAVTAAVLGFLLLNWFFTPPQGTLTVADAIDVLALAMFLLVAVAVASVVDKAARRSVQAGLARQEADTLTMLNRTLLQSDKDVVALLGLVQETFAVDTAALLRRTGDTWQLAGAVGDDPPLRPDEADTSADVSPTLVLALRGNPLPPHERRVLAAFATHLAVVLEREELARRAEAARRLEEGNRVRTALLAAVSHDLRTPLAGVKAAVSSLRSPDVRWSPEDEAELLETIEESADRLHTIVANLLDLSRLQADAVRPATHEVGLDDVVSRTIAEMPQARAVELRLPDDLPPVLADAGLLDRIVANLVDNAVRHSPSDRPVVVSLSHVGDRVQLHVVDHGPGVPDSEKEQMFEAFQRLGDTRSREGLGLGLAVAKGLTEALGGLLIPENTPGGGLTMVVDLPTVPAAKDEKLSEAGRP